MIASLLIPIMLASSASQDECMLWPEKSRLEIPEALRTSTRAALPMVIVEPSFDYDERWGLEGSSVSLRLDISGTGRVVGVKIEDATDAKLAGASATAALNWKFFPAAVDCSPVSTKGKRMLIRVVGGEIEAFDVADA